MDRPLLVPLRKEPFQLRFARSVWFQVGPGGSKVSECIVIAKAAFELKRLKCGFWCYCPKICTQHIKSLRKKYKHLRI